MSLPFYSSLPLTKFWISEFLSFMDIEELQFQPLNRFGSLPSLQLIYSYPLVCPSNLSFFKNKFVHITFLLQPFIGAYPQVGVTSIVLQDLPESLKFPTSCLATPPQYFYYLVALQIYQPHFLLYFLLQKTYLKARLGGSQRILRISIIRYSGLHRAKNP